MDILEEARAIFRERGKTYGNHKVRFDRTARMVSGLLQINLKPHHIASIIIIEKLSRSEKGFKKDNWLDIINYAAIACDLQSKEGQFDDTKTKLSFCIILHFAWVFIRTNKKQKVETTHITTKRVLKHFFRRNANDLYLIFENGFKKFPETVKKMIIEISWILARKTYENRRKSWKILDFLSLY